MAELATKVDTALLLDEWRQAHDREAAFRKIFERHYRAVFGYFSKRGFSAPESQELTQEAFIRVYKGLDSFRGGAPFEAWLFEVTANVYRNYLRDAAAQKRSGTEVPLENDNAETTGVAAGLIDERAVNPLERVEETERAQALREAVTTLPEQMRRCLELRIYQELSYQEIATVMRLSIETVKAHLFQARKQLRVKLESYFQQIDV